MTTISLHTKLSNEHSEDMEFECDSTPPYGERYTLRIPAYAEGGKLLSPAQTVCLTGEEFDTLVGIVKGFRNMKEEARNATGQ